MSALHIFALFFSGKFLSHVLPEEIQNFKFRILIGSDANSANSDVTTTRKCNDVQMIMCER